MGAVTAIGLLTAAYKHFNPTIEEQKKKLSELNAEYENTVQEIKSLGDEINENNKRIQELTGKGFDLM